MLSIEGDTKNKQSKRRVGPPEPSNDKYRRGMIYSKRLLKMNSKAVKISVKHVGKFLKIFYENKITFRTVK